MSENRSEEVEELRRLMRIASTDELINIAIERLERNMLDPRSARSVAQWLMASHMALYAVCRKLREG